VSREPADEWVALRIELPVEIAEAVTSFLLDAGAPGVVTEERDATHPPPAAGCARLEAPLPVADETRVGAALTRYLTSLGEIEPAARRVTVARVAVPRVDWNAIARAHHRPLAIGRRLLVAPPWDVPDAPDRAVLIVEPGMAFGTGQHATTRTCLEEIDALVGTVPIASALDVGTGSGLLALALARLGVARVVALDVDPAVLPIARATLAGNGAADVLLLAGTARAVRGRFDLVLANLLADTIVAEAEALAAVVAPGGRLVLSGILVAQTPAVRASFPAWRLAGRRDADGWTTLTLVRNA
jgi:ribosomal protein L11 methyltransferase